MTIVDMRRRIFLKIPVAAILTVVVLAADAREGRGGDAMRRTPPDFEIAVKAEYERLSARGTREALELFIARHPKHPLADKAREEIRRLYE